MENRERSVVSARIISTKMGNESDCTSGGCIISRIEAAALLLVLSKRDRKEGSWPTPNGGRTISTPPRRRVPGRLLFQISISSSKGGRHRWQAARMHKVVAVCGNDSKLSRAGGASYVKSTYSYSLSKFLGRFRAITAGEIVRGETCAGNIYIYVHTFCGNEKKKKGKRYIYIYISFINFLEKSFSSMIFSNRISVRITKISYANAAKRGGTFSLQIN